MLLIALQPHEIDRCNTLKSNASYQAVQIQKFNMVYYCSVCKAKTNKDESRTVHRFPLKNEFLLAEWLKAIDKGPWQPSGNSRLCSTHFEENCFELCGKTRQLKKDAVPTIFTKVVRCVVCSSCKQQGSGRSFYKFPIKDPQRLQKWVSNLGFNHTWAPTQNSVLCSDHFDQSCFKVIKGERTLKLKQSGIPTLSDFAMDSASPEINWEESDGFDAAPNEPYLSEVTGLFTMPQSLEQPSTSSCNANPEQSRTNDCANPTNECKYEEQEPAASTSIAPATPMNTSTVSLTTNRKRVMHDHHYADSPNTLRKKLQASRLLLKKKQRECRMHAQHVRRLKQTVSTLKEIARTSKQ